MGAHSHPIRIRFQVEKRAAPADLTEEPLFFACVGCRANYRCSVGVPIVISAREFDSDIGGLNAGPVLTQKIAERDSAGDLKFRSAIFIRIVDALF
jgi:hypothetical protein